MNCITCGYKLTQLFSSVACDKCDGLLENIATAEEDKITYFWYNKDQMYLTHPDFVTATGWYVFNKKTSGSGLSKFATHYVCEVVYKDLFYIPAGTKFWIVLE